MRGIFMVATPERRTQCIRIQPVVGDAIRIALAYPVDLKMSNGAIYQGGIYAQPTDISSALSGGPTVIDFGSVYDADSVTRDQIQSGYWDRASVYSFFTDWANPVEDEEEDRAYTFGKLREEDERFTVEMMSRLDMLNQSTGRLITQGCTYVFGDSHPGGEMIATDRSRCGKDGDFYSFQSPVTTLASQTQFIGGALTGLFPDDYFGYGEIIFESGANVGATYKIVAASFASGQINLVEPFYYPIELGDLFRVRAGCRKRFQEDCVTKWGNGKNFGGFPSVPQKSTVQKFGDQ
jgi:uncharacterized phage protein (TIGR02218 family)